MEKLASLWVDPDPRPSAAPARTVANYVAWPVAALIVIHRVVVLAWTGSPTDDFTTVWSAARRFVDRVPVYDEIYHHVNPHYLYNPGATLLLSPLGLTGNLDAARSLFILANAGAIIAALAWLTLRSGFRLSHPVFPFVVAVAFLTESVTNTLVFSNINGILLLALVAFLDLFLRGRPWAAGLILGLAIVVKPMFAPLIVLPLMRLEWRTPLVAVAVPAALNAVAWPLTPGAGDYVSKVMPYLSVTRDYANASLAGFAAYYGMPGWLHVAVFAALAAAVAVAVLGLARYRYSDEWLWAAASSGVLIAGVCLLSSLGQAYYSMMLFPAIFTVFRPLSPMHTAPVWVGIAVFLSPLQWTTHRMPNVGANLDIALVTAAWSVFVIAIAAWVVSVSTNRSTAKKEPTHDTTELPQLDRGPVARQAQR
ncbi:arabinofuranan 3-O-arabinosyltransferase [Corynebacterium mycetoides]|uniref:Arabinofuranan 3-O-arabinosyltransferase n=1 Tax=Corynebacterium mycetoides TaxID=38302 RepID=A0A1G9MS83_9CORY|nr:glycosyltransferase family 87 protein [Corynebacterium mycetoides]SDL76515.1 arabinofuranan 3-O-arabinosyltransferase [Corynebacterium mycetoides]